MLFFNATAIRFIASYFALGFEEGPFACAGIIRMIILV